MIDRAWYSVWYVPRDSETIAYMTTDRMASIGGSTLQGGQGQEVHSVNQGVAILRRWCRENCKVPGIPVSIRGRTGWAFDHAEDALLFKLTWG